MSDEPKPSETPGRSRSGSNELSTLFNAVAAGLNCTYVATQSDGLSALLSALLLALVLMIGHRRWR